MTTQHTYALSRVLNCFQSWKGSKNAHIKSLNTNSGSNRLYFEIEFQDKTYIGTFNNNPKENEAFIYFSNFFRTKAIPLPQVFYVSKDKLCYIQENIGQLSLMQLLKQEGNTTAVFAYYKDSIEKLWQMQSRIKGINFNKAYPRPQFDSRALLWDLNYFKYYFLKLHIPNFDENALEDDFYSLAQNIEQLPSNRFFMFRDFQARNIHIHQGELYFIDFQGGRKGPPLYDLVSLLYQSSAQLDQQWREDLKNHYKKLSIKSLGYSEQDFETDFILMRIIRSLQTLGAYGFRGKIEQKNYFIESIPPAITNIKLLIKNSFITDNFPYLCHLLHQIDNS